MKKVFFRSFVLLLALMLVFSILAGCTKKEEEAETTTTTKAATTTTQKATEQTTSGTSETEPIEENKWAAYAFDPDKVYEYTVVLQTWIAPEKDAWGIQNLLNYNIKLNVLDITRDKYDEMMNIRLGAGDIPDSFPMYDYLTFDKFYKQGVLAGIDPEVYPRLLPYHYYAMKEYEPDCWLHAQRDGLQYAIPKGAFVPNQFRRPIVYNGKWMEAVGITKVPATLDEFYELMHAFAWDDPDGNAKKDTYGFSDSAFAPIFGAFGGSICTNPVTGDRYWVERDGKLEYFAVSEDARKGLEFLKKCYDEEILDPEFITGETLGGYWAGSQLFINQRIGMSALGSFYHWLHPEIWPNPEDGYSGYNATELKKLDPEAASKITFGEALQGPDGYKYMRRSAIYQYEQEGLGVQMENDLERLGKWLSFANWQMESLDNAMLFYGIEGLHYEWVEGKGPVYINPQNDAHFAEKRLIPFLIFNTSFPRLWQDPTTERDYKIFHSLGFSRDGLENALKIPLPSQGDYASELYKMEDTVFIQIITGDQPLSYFDEFVEDWYEQGGEILTQEANEWYDSLMQ